MFHRVERQYLLGLRSGSPALRRQFFELYHRHITTTLYDRLAFIIVGQDWDAMSGQFWLKQALDLLLSVLKVGSVRMLGVALLCHAHQLLCVFKVGGPMVLLVCTVAAAKFHKPGERNNGSGIALGCPLPSASRQHVLSHICCLCAPAGGGAHHAGPQQRADPSPHHRHQAERVQPAARRQHAAGAAAGGSAVAAAGPARSAAARTGAWLGSWSAWVKPARAVSAGPWWGGSAAAGCQGGGW
jgi:hypothetical protein